MNTFKHCYMFKELCFKVMLNINGYINARKQRERERERERERDRERERESILKLLTSWGLVPL